MHADDRCGNAWAQCSARSSSTTSSACATSTSSRDRSLVDAHPALVTLRVPIGFRDALSALQECTLLPLLAHSIVPGASSLPPIGSTKEEAGRLARGTEGPDG